MGSVVTPSWSPALRCATLRARHRGASTWVLELAGEADIATELLLEHELAQLVAGCSEQAVVDVTWLSFCDIASAHLILTTRRWVPVSVVGATRSVQRVFDLLDLVQAQRLPHYLPARHSEAQPVRRPHLSVVR